MKKPIIGILANRLIIEDGMFPGMERVYVSDDYVKAVLKAGGIPILIPVNKEKEIVQAQINAVDGVLLTGGYDVNPLLYGEEPSQKLGFTYGDVDDFDILVISAANSFNKPMFGICKGLQILNVYFGGTLYQDISEAEGAYIKHTQSSRKQEAGHSTFFKEGSILYEIFGESTLTNSFHHQSIKELAPGFKVTASAKDNIIEGIEKEEGNFVVAVQWHPEMMHETDLSMVKLFERFIDECRNKR